MGIVASVPLVTGAQVMPRAEVHPMVLAETSGGGDTDFFVILRDRADLGPAGLLEGKTQRGQFVYTPLRQTAESSQAALRGW